MFQKLNFICRCIYLFIGKPKVVAVRERDLLHFLLKLYPNIWDSALRVKRCFHWLFGPPLLKELCEWLVGCHKALYFSGGICVMLPWSEVNSLKYTSIQLSENANISFLKIIAIMDILENKMRILFFSYEKYGVHMKLKHIWLTNLF